MKGGGGALSLFSVANARIDKCRFLINRKKYPVTTSVVLGGDNKTNIRLSAVFFDTPGGMDGVGPVHIASTVEGNVKFFLPFCFDLSEEDSISFPEGHNPLKGQPFFNCTNDCPPGGDPTGTMPFTPELTQTVPTTMPVTATRPATPTRHATKTSGSHSRTRSPTATRRMTPMKTRSATVPVSTQVAATTPQATVAATLTMTATPSATKDKVLPVRDIVGIAVGAPLIIGLIVAVVVLVVKVYRKRPATPATLDPRLLIAEPRESGDFGPILGSGPE
jgi:hypothetical protein